MTAEVECQDAVIALLHILMALALLPTPTPPPARWEPGQKHRQSHPIRTAT